jgi:hypothetical protein
MPDGPAAVELPDRVTVHTCIACGAMGRAERCDGDCAEHKLVLVTAGEYDALRAAADEARARVARPAPVVRRLAEAEATPPDPRDALRRVREDARAALRDAGREADDAASPDTVTGWWCDRCGNPRGCRDPEGGPGAANWEASQAQARGYVCMSAAPSRSSCGSGRRSSSSGKSSRSSKRT